jgi:hypothetical protein
VSDIWRPELTPKGRHLFDSYKRYILVDGPRKSAKSISIDHKICRHLWEVNHARVGVICRTTKQGKVGVWDDLTSWVIATWIHARVSSDHGQFGYTMEPKMEADTKMSHFRVRNWYGEESSCVLHSLEHDDDVEEKFKDSRFSMIYLVEADKFKDRKVFSTLSTQLRALGVPFELHQLICDCNPPEEGEDHFLHDIFLKRWGHHSREEGVDPNFDVSFERIQMLLEDNTFLTDQEKTEQRSLYKYDSNLYNRWTRGDWVKHGVGGHFSEVFVPGVHIRGDASGPNEEEWEVIVPPKTCTELLTGWDPGDTNHAAVIATKRESDIGTCFDFIDELVVIDQAVSIDDFVDAFLEKMNFWEDFLKSRYGIQKISWRHWSDLSAFKFNAAADTYVYLQVQERSNNRIIFNSFGRAPGTIAQRLSLTKKLLFAKRMFVSAQLNHMHDMLTRLRKSRIKTELIDPHAKEKHVFDAATYMLASESPMDLERRVSPVTNRTLISMRT